MSRSVHRRWALLGVVCAVFCGPAAVARADNNSLRATLNSYGPKIVRDKAAISKGEADYPKGKWRPLIRALSREIADIHSLESQLSPDPASTDKGRQGKSQILKGLRMIASGETTFVHYLKLAKGGPVSPKTGPALAEIQKGHKVLKAGLKLLANAG